MPVIHARDAAPPAPATPSIRHSLTELQRSGIELTRLAVGLGQLVDRAPKGDGRPVLVLPGYGGNDASTTVLRHFLGRIGYSARPLGLGTNAPSAAQRIKSVDDAVAFRERMVAAVLERMEAICSETDELITLVGWSMGGLYAYDAAAAAPHGVRMVVTLGSPFGDPRGTALFSLLRRLNRSDVPVETQNYAAWLAKRSLPAEAPPVRILYSPSDGIVSPEVAAVPDHPAVERIAVRSSHLGFGINPDALAEVARQLAGDPLAH